MPCGNGRGMAGWHQARAELRQMDAKDSSLCARGKGRNVAALAAAYRIKQARNRVRNRARIRIHAARCTHEREWGQAAISAAGTANKWWRVSAPAPVPAWMQAAAFGRIRACSAVPAAEPA